MTLSVTLRHAFPGQASTAARLDIAFDAPTPGTTVLFGPSGAGKSSVVSAVAGLLRADDCRISIDGEMLVDTAARIDLPPERRRIGMVFQDARLFPHMTVLSNLRYGLRRAPRTQPARIALPDIVDLLGIGHLLDRRPIRLSGGERQRVAIGRALLSQPRLLAMDEPLASLDEGRKAEILPYLARLKTAFGLPILYVTHALDEVARLADTLVLIENGRSQAAGPLTELAGRGDLPLAARDDASAILHAPITRHDTLRRLTELDLGGQPLLVPLLDEPVGTTMRLRIPARDVILAQEVPHGISLHNVVPSQVRAVTEQPGRHASLVELVTGPANLLARITPDAVSHLNLAPGRPVLALIKSTAIEPLGVEAAVRR